MKSSRKTGDILSIDDLDVSVPLTLTHDESPRFLTRPPEVPSLYVHRDLWKVGESVLAVPLLASGEREVFEPGPAEVFVSPAFVVLTLGEDVSVGPRPP